MVFLSIDTSTQYTVVALSDEKSLLYGSRRLSEKGRSDSLMNLLTHCLKYTKTKLDAIDFFGVGVGPGSFTGLRIGLSTVKGLSFALKKPCYVFSSLDAIASNGRRFLKKQLCVLVDARRSNVYGRFYTFAAKNHGLQAVDGFGRSSIPPKEESRASARIGLHKADSFAFQRTSQDLLIDYKSLMKRIDFLNRQGEEVFFFGDGLKMYKEELKKKSKHFRFAPRKFWYPTPESIALLTREAAKSNKPLNCFQLLPQYLYKQDCQVKPR